MNIVVGITGTTGVIYGVRMIEALKQIGVDSHLVMSEWAKKCLKIETDFSIEYVESLATTCSSEDNMASSVSSGSHKTNGMVVIPCSMKTMSSIANDYEESLVARAAAVTIKESRKLVLVPRETPLTTMSIENMLKLSQYGVTILPASPGFYHKPDTIDDLINHIVGKCLDQFGIKHELFKRWKTT